MSKNLIPRSYLIDSWLKQSLFSAKELQGFPSSSVGKEPACNAEDPGSIPGSGRSPEEGIGNPFQYSCLENFMDRGAWWATVHRVAKSQTRLKRLSMHVAPNRPWIKSHATYLSELRCFICIT